MSYLRFKLTHFKEILFDIISNNPYVRFVFLSVLNMKKAVDHLSIFVVILIICDMTVSLLFQRHITSISCDSNIDSEEKMCVSSYTKLSRHRKIRTVGHFDTQRYIFLNATEGHHWAAVWTFKICQITSLWLILWGEYAVCWVKLTCEWKVTLQRLKSAQTQSKTQLHPAARPSTHVSVLQLLEGSRKILNMMQHITPKELKLLLRFSSV